MKLNQNLPEQGKFDVFPSKGVVAGVLGADEAINIASRTVYLNEPVDKIRADLLRQGFVIWFYGFTSVQINVSMATLVTLWGELTDIPVTEDGVYLDAPFLHFAVGDEVSKVWHWFEEANSRFKVAEHLGIGLKKGVAA
jgi:hypothetical protein